MGRRSRKNKHRTREVNRSNRRLRSEFSFSSKSLKQLDIRPIVTSSPSLPTRNLFKSEWKRVEHAPNVNKKTSFAPLSSIPIFKPLPALPERTRTCVQRAQRREVLHAIGKAGKTGQKRPVWTQKSKMRCK